MTIASVTLLLLERRRRQKLVAVSAMKLFLRLTKSHTANATIKTAKYLVKT